MSNEQDVAQPGRAAALDAEARRFKSSHPDHFRWALAPICWLRWLWRSFLTGVNVNGHSWREHEIRVERGVRTYHHMRCDTCGRIEICWSEP